MLVPGPERKWFTDVRGNFATFGFEHHLENVRERNRDRHVGLNLRGKSQESSNQRGSSNVSPSVVTVQGTPKSGSHSNPARGSGEKSEVSKALVGHKRGAGSASGDTDGAKRSTKKYTCEFPGACGLLTSFK